jgi:hypothetical protein
VRSSSLAVVTNHPRCQVKAMSLLLPPESPLLLWEISPLLLRAEVAPQHPLPRCRIRMMAKLDLTTV